jgi:hypothetical protein
MEGPVTRRDALLALAALAPSLRARAAGPAGAPGLKPGDRVPPLHLTALDGLPRKLDWPAGKSTVVMFFLPSCSVCHSMFPRWNQAFARKPANLEAVGVALEMEPPGFFDAYQIRFPVYRGPGVAPADVDQRRAFAEAFKVRQVPTTLRVGPGGVVEECHVGPLDLMKLGEVFRA